MFQASRLTYSSGSAGEQPVRPTISGCLRRCGIRQRRGAALTVHLCSQNRCGGADFDVVPDVVPVPMAKGLVVFIVKRLVGSSDGPRRGVGMVAGHFDDRRLRTRT
jgi:hypothetical protein